MSEPQASGRTPAWRQYLDAGMHAGEMTRAQAQRLVAQLVKEGQIAEGRGRAYVDELVTRSRKRGEELRKLVRREIQSQLSALGLATKADLAKLERKLARTTAKPRARTPSKRPAGAGRSAGSRSSSSK
ncbi:MAG: hypothetical protein HYU28_02235 [Actinobacteria bacterium]|nr:hypothetical protein [Actinomycetota bacterium]